jgi:hypothetical protein
MASLTVLSPVVRAGAKASELLAENYRVLALYYAIHDQVSRRRLGAVRERRALGSTIESRRVDRSIASLRRANFPATLFSAEIKLVQVSDSANAESRAPAFPVPRSV